MASATAKMETILVEKLKEETGKDYKAWLKIWAKEEPKNLLYQYEYKMLYKNLEFNLVLALNEEP